MKRRFRPDLLVSFSRLSPMSPRPAAVTTLLVMLAAGLPTGVVIPASAAAPVHLAEPGASVPVAVDADTTGGYLIAWQDPESLAIHGQRISPGGFPEPTHVELAPNLPFQVSDLRLAFSRSGRAALVWTQPAGADQIGIGGGILGTDGVLLRRFEIAHPIPDPAGLVTSFGPSVAALPSGGYVITWTVGVQEDPLGDPLKPTDQDAYVARIDEEGSPVGAAVRLHQENAGSQVALDIGASESNIVIAWVSNPLTIDQEYFVRVLEPELLPRSEEIPVEKPRRGSLAVAPDGRFIVGSAMAGFGPDDFRARLQIFEPDGAPIGPPFNAHPDGRRHQGAPAVEITGEGNLWALWGETHDVDGVPGGRLELALMLRSFSLEGRPTSRPEELVRIGNGAFAFTGGAEGALVTWTPTSSTPFLAGQVVGRPPDAEIPPEELGLESPELPGFRVWVRIAGGDLEAIWATETVPCTAEALCAAGLLPDRAEVIVRVAGPKPNGFLWPIMVKLTTSRVEIWMEQLGTGDIQYYLLPGASPGSELLPGLFDRAGFRP